MDPWVRDVFVNKAVATASVACGWAGAVMPKIDEKAIFYESVMDPRTNGRTHPLIESLARD